MPIQPDTADHPPFGHRDARMIRNRNEVAIYKSSPVFFMDASDLYDFIDLLSGKSLIEKVPYKEELAPRKFGAWKGKVWMAPDFDDGQAIIELFEGTEKSPDGEDD